MALIYTKLTSDKTTVLSPREGAGRKFNFDTWTDLRMAMFCSAVAATGSNDDNVAETIAITNANDLVTFGLKDDSQTNPGETGSLFLGVSSTASGVTNSNTPNNGLGPAGYFACGYHDTTRVSGGTVSTGTLGSGQASAASGYASICGVRLVILNIGTASQSVDIYGYKATVSGTDYSLSNLTTLLNAITIGAWNAASNIAWNTGAAARAIPDCVWIRPSLYLNSLRISAITAKKFA